MTTPNAQSVPTRSEANIADTWDLSLMYADDAAWRTELATIDGRIDAMHALVGTISNGAAALVTVLKTREALMTVAHQLYIYAHCRYDSDSGDATGQELNAQAQSMVAKAQAALAFVEPEILALPEAQLRGWISADATLSQYAYYFDVLLRNRTHTRSAEVEGVLAQLSEVTSAPYAIFGMLNNTDMTFGSITDEAGNTVELSHGRYGKYLESNDRRVRKDTFHTYYKSFTAHKNTLAMTLSQGVKSNVVNARIRGYNSAVEAALAPNDIPVPVYHNLVSTVKANLPKMHRYYALRKKLMKLDDLRIYDLYPPINAGVELTVDYREGCQLVAAALRPLGADYAAALDMAYESRWIDVYENKGKRSGAYSTGSYTTAPYILLNYQSRLDDVFTLAHELGHSMHSFYTRKTQPMHYGDYTIFVAEVASTLNEALLVAHLLKTRSEPDVRRHLIVQQLEDIRRTLVRQTMFAEFELDMHTRSENDEPLTTEGLTERYYQMVKDYHGPAVTLDDDIGYEWSRIPHFYYNFYVYQYATGISAALALADNVEKGDPTAVKNYLGFLSGGSSKSSIDLLRGAGVDMASPAPVQAAMDRFDALLDQLEQLG
jgi:oligoendopeptidase F